MARNYLNPFGKRPFSSRAKRKKFMRGYRKKFLETWAAFMQSEPRYPIRAIRPFKYETRLKMDDKIELVTCLTISNQNK